jgi:glycosyltransferase involved in cell wall biosynthesis
MNLLVLAQTPPPHHGQSAMVQLLLDELPRAAPSIEVHHVNLALSATGADIGRWQPGKLLAARRALRAAHAAIHQSGCDTLYYIPAPGKRIALWRDLMLLGSLRPRVKNLVLHWHASGLGHWLQTRAKGGERRAAQRLLGQADLSIALAPSLLADIEMLHPRQTAIVPNGIPDPFADHAPPTRRPKSADEPTQILFMGSGSAAKGLFRTIDALAHLPDNVRLTFAGDFADPVAAQKFAAAQTRHGPRLRHTGFVDNAGRQKLLAESDVLAFPTTYEHEAFPLVLIEALAADLPIVTTRWRAIPELLPNDFQHFVPTASAPSLAHQLQAAIRETTPGLHRSYYEKHYTATAFAERMADGLGLLPPPAHG